MAAAPRSAEADVQRVDPDAVGESTALLDHEVLDDEFDRRLTDVPAARQPIVLDACLSDGFSKDVVISSCEWAHSRLKDSPEGLA